MRLKSKKKIGLCLLCIISVQSIINLSQYRHITDDGSWVPRLTYWT